MESEFDEWFKLEQEKLDDMFKKKVIEKIASGQEYTIEKEKFEKKQKKLFQDYEKKNYMQMKTQKWKKLLMKPVNKINEGMDEFVKAFRE